MMEAGDRLKELRLRLGPKLVSELEGLLEEQRASMEESRLAMVEVSCRFS